MVAKTESDKEKTKIGLVELLREVARRLKEEIFLLAFLFALLVTLVAISTQDFAMWVSVTFIALYLIAVISYFSWKIAKTRSELQEKPEEYTMWTVSYPYAFQNPYVIAKKRPNLRIVHFDMGFTIKNCCKESFLVTVYVESSTQAVCFVLDSPRKVWRRRLGIIPYREEVEVALDNFATRSISPNQEETITFHGWYRPHFAYRDFDFRRKIAIAFRVFGKSEESFLKKYVDSHEKKIHVPFKDIVRYAKKN